MSFEGLKIESDGKGGRIVGRGVRFERIRRITGYLVGDVRTRFNDAKAAEERDRVKHFNFGMKNI